MHVDRIWTGQLLDGVPGVNQTLDAMAALVRRDATNLRVRSFALELVSTCSGHDFDCEIEQLYNFVRDSITYRRDPVQVESVQDTLRTLHVFQSGDCDDLVVCLASLLGAIGHRSRFVVLGKTREKFTHVYLEVLTRQGWVALDPTPEQATVGWQSRGAIRQTYEIWPEKNSLSPALFAGFAFLIYWWLK